MQHFNLIKKFFMLFFIFFINIVLFSNVNSSNNNINKYFDKTVADKETFLTENDFQGLNFRQKKNLVIRFKNNESKHDEEKINDLAMYNKNRFEGDIANPGLASNNLKSFINSDTSAFYKDTLSSSADSLSKLYGIMHNAVRSTYLKWPSKKIPYTISEQYTSIGREKIAEAIKEYNERTCVKFVPKKPTDIDYIHITPDDGCYSLVGKVGGRQPVSIGKGCVQKGIILHELMHSIGFFHEQSRADRDDYIKIIWKNVEDGVEDQFDKYPLSIIDNLGSEYDYSSIMHYGAYAFSGNGLPTIEPLKPNVQIGQRKGFSEIDLLKINKLYDCPNLNSSLLSNVSKEEKNKTQTKTVISTTVNIIKSAKNIENYCVDNRRECPSLASWGYCNLPFSRDYMIFNCQKSCKKCISSNNNYQQYRTKCQDLRLYCRRWAAGGLCNALVFREYMHSNCPYSCNLCR